MPQGERLATDFPGGLILIDGGLALLRGPDRRLDQAEAQVICIGERHDPKRMIEKNLAGTSNMPPDGPGSRRAPLRPLLPRHQDCLTDFVKQRPGR